LSGLYEADVKKIVNAGFKAKATKISSLMTGRIVQLDKINEVT